jgi:hypothetical protein
MGKFIVVLGPGDFPKISQTTIQCHVSEFGHWLQEDGFTHFPGWNMDASIITMYQEV